MSEPRIIDANAFKESILQQPMVEWCRVLVGCIIEDMPTIDPETLPIVKELRQKQRWIPCSERLPEDERDGETVLAIVNGNPKKNITLIKAIMTAGYFEGEGWCVNEYPEWETPNITHWMPLLEPPKEV